jgi:hypothetical protein
MRTIYEEWLIDEADWTDQVSGASMGIFFESVLNPGTNLYIGCWIRKVRPSSRMYDLKAR